MKTGPLLLIVTMLFAAACAAPSEADQLGQARQPMMDDDGVDCSTCAGADCVSLHCFEDWTHSGGGDQGPYTGGGSGGGWGGGDDPSPPSPPDDPTCLSQCEWQFYWCYQSLGGEKNPGVEERCLERMAVCVQACDAARTESVKLNFALKK